MGKIITRTMNFKREILSKFSFLSNEVEIRNSVNLTDINIELEDLFCKILNILKCSNFKNANTYEQNIAGFDLTDGSMFIQVTSNNSLDKVKETIDKTGLDKIKKTYMLYLSNSKPKRNKNSFIGKYVEFDWKTQELCFVDIVKMAEELDKIEELYYLLEQEFNFEMPNYEWYINDYDYKKTLVKDRYRPNKNLAIHENQKIKNYLFKYKSDIIIESLNELEKIDENYLIRKYESQIKSSHSAFSGGSYTKDEVKDLVEKIIIIKKKFVDYINDFFKNEFVENQLNQLKDEYFENIKTNKIYNSDKYNNDNALDNCINNLVNEMENYYKYISNSVAYIVGETGVGKTHFVFDMCNENLKNGNYAKIILARYINNNLLDIYDTQINKTYNFEKIIESLGKNSNNSYLYIDGINESKYFLEYHQEFLNKLNEYNKVYPKLKIVITIRSEYLSSFKINYDNSLIFDLKEFGYYNVQETLKAYNIELPYSELGLLRNPNYLFMFCEIYENESLKKVPQIDLLICKYLELKKNQIKDQCDMNLKKIVDRYNLLEDLLNAISVYRFNESVEIYLLNDIISALKNVKTYEHNKRYLDELINKMEECSLIEIYQDKFLFKFNVLQDYLDSLFIIRNNLIIKSSGQLYMMAKLLPAINGTEIYDYTNINNELIFEITESFLNSISTRVDCEIIDGISIEYIDKIYESIKKEIEDTQDIECVSFKLILFWNNLILGSIRSNKLFFYTSQLILKMDLGFRDVIFTLYLNDILGENNQLPIVKFYYNEYIELLEEELFFIIWGLASSNRELRDNLTKKLISYYENRLYDLIKLTTKYFVAINDEYVLERILAIILGILYKSTLFDKIDELINLINNLFAQSKNYNIIRYCKLIIDRINLFNNSNYKLVEKNINFIKPDYDSYKNLNSKNSKVAFSIATDNGYSKYGDWGRYYIEYYVMKFVEDTTQIYNNLEKDFLDSLSEDEMELYNKYCSEENKTDIKFEKGQLILQKDIELESFLSRRQIKLYEKMDENKRYTSILQGVEIEDKIAYEILKLSQDYISYKAINLLGLYNNKNYDRHYHRRERISKKYQWIAFHNLIGELSYNFLIKDYDEITKPSFLYDIPFDFEPLFFENNENDVVTYIDILYSYSITHNKFIESWDEIDISTIKSMINIKKDDGYLSLTQDANLYDYGCELWFYSNAFILDDENLRKFTNMMDDKSIKNNVTNLRGNINGYYNYEGVVEHDLKFNVNLYSLINEYEYHSEYDYSIQGALNIQLLNTKLLNDNLYLLNGDYYNLNNKKVSRYYTVEDDNKLFIDIEYLKNIATQKRTNIYFYVTYGKWLKIKELFNIRSEKIFCILYEYDIVNDKLILVKGFKYDLDEKEPKYYEIN